MPRCEAVLKTFHMTQKKSNSGGKKFQSRMPEEKRVRVVTKTDKPKGSGGKKSKPFEKRESFDRSQGPGYPPKRGATKKFGDSTDGFRDRKSYGNKPADKRSGPYEKREPSERGTGYGYPPKKTGTKKYGDSAETGRDRKPYGKTTGDKRTGGYDRKGPSDRPAGYGYPPKKPGVKKYGDAADTGTERRSTGRKTPDKKYFKEDKKSRKSGPETPDNYKGRRKSYGKASDDLLKGKTLAEGEVRINRYIANSGMCSRREADVMIEQGLVTLNGVVVTELGGKVVPGDDVRVDGKRINPEKPVYILLNKPKGYITSTSDPSERATVMDLIDLPGKERIYPVGRLDRNTTGVLLLTNDGELAQKLMHPSFEIKKIYKAKLDQRPAKEHMLAWVNGVELEDGFMSFEQIGFVDEEDPNVVGLEVHSGRNRIVRRMFEHFGYDVVSLDRVMLGDFDHLRLGRGKWRFLNDKEIRYVEQLKRMKGKKSRR